MFGGILKDRFVEGIMSECIETYKKKYPQEYRIIKELNKEWGDALGTSAHLGLTRDGSEEDRQLNIDHDKWTDNLKKELHDRVKDSNFDYVVNDIIRQKGERNVIWKKIMSYGDDDKITILNPHDIGFKTVPVDNCSIKYKY